MVRQRKINSIAIPALGCGQGGLQWKDVFPLIQSAFEQVSEVEVILYPHPAESPRHEPCTYSYCHGKINAEKTGLI